SLGDRGNTPNTRIGKYAKQHGITQGRISFPYPSTSDADETPQLLAPHVGFPDGTSLRSQYECVPLLRTPPQSLPPAHAPAWEHVHADASQSIRSRHPSGKRDGTFPERSQH